MKMIIVVALALAAVAAAAPTNEPVQILRSENDQKPDGSYSYTYETGDGIQKQETGELKEALDEDKKPHQVVVVRGSYSYTDPEGNVQTVTYEADENGFRAKGNGIPEVPVARR